jgi:hypothetical protein
VIAYKFLRPGGVGLLSSVRWPLPEADVPGDWLAVSGPLVPCRHGLHACRQEDLAHWIGEELWYIELAEEVMTGHDSVVARRARVVRRAEAWHTESAREFASGCAGRARQLLAAKNVPAGHAAWRYLEQAEHLVQSTQASLAAYTVALAIAASDTGRPEMSAFRAERAAQSQLLAKAANLEAPTLPSPA